MEDYTKTDVFQRDLTRDRQRLAELKKVEHKQKGNKYKVSNGFVYTAHPERWDGIIKE